MSEMCSCRCGYCLSRQLVPDGLYEWQCVDCGTINGDQYSNPKDRAMNDCCFHPCDKPAIIRGTQRNSEIVFDTCILHQQYLAVATQGDVRLFNLYLDGITDYYGYWSTHVNKQR